MNDLARYTCNPGNLLSSIVSVWGNKMKLITALHGALEFQCMVVTSVPSGCVLIIISGGI